MKLGARKYERGKQGAQKYEYESAVARPKKACAQCPALLLNGSLPRCLTARFLTGFLISQLFTNSYVTKAIFFRPVLKNSCE
jgi:hypothetical protein